MLLFPITMGGGFYILTNRINNKAVAACQDNSDIRIKFVEFIDSSLQRSKNSLVATLNSPNTSEEQKTVAQKNLDALQKFIDKAHNTFKTHEC